MFSQSLPLAGEQGDDLYASLLETSIPDMMGTSFSQMQDILPLQTYGSIGMSGLPVDSEDAGVLGHMNRASTIEEPLERQSPSNVQSLDLGAPRYSWYVLMVIFWLFIGSDRVRSNVLAVAWCWRE